MTLNHRQSVIIKFAQSNGGKITKKQANELLVNTYYHNGEKYIGEILSRLVKRNVFRRVKIGHFELTGVSKGVIVEPVAENQQSLF
jgi:hypothetical protein